MWDIYAEDQRVIPPSCNGINLVEKNHPCWDIQQQPKSLIGHTIAGIRSPTKKAWNFPATIERVGWISLKMGKFLVEERSAWRIILVSNWLVTPILSHLAHLEGEYPYLGDLLTMVINHLLTGMILQVLGGCDMIPLISKNWRPRSFFLPLPRWEPERWPNLYSPEVQFHR